MEDLGAGIGIPVPPAKGGTGLASFSVGDLLYADGTTSLARKAHPSLTNYVLTSTTGPNGLSWLTVANMLGGLVAAQGAVIVKGASAWGALALGTSGYVLQSDGTDTVFGVVPERLPKRFVEGLVVRYASATTITVTTGKARDKADAANMSLTTAGGVTVDITTVGALGGERKTLSGTSTFTNGNTAVSGSTTAYLSDFGTRQLTVTGVVGGTAITGTSSAAVITASSSVLGQVAVDDLVGDASSPKGFFRVTAIDAAGTSITIESTPGSAFSGQNLYVIENPRIESNAGRVYRVARITSDTALVLTGNANNTENGVTAYSTSKKTNPVDTADGWRAVWLVSGGSGTTVLVSTQRTTPYCAGSGTFSPTGYGTSYRRIGWVQLDTGANIPDFSGHDGGCVRFSQIRPTAILSNASASTSDASVVASTGAPPTARRLLLQLLMVSPNVVAGLLVSRRGSVGGAGSNYEALVTCASTTTSGFTTAMVSCDAAQGITYRTDGNTTGDGVSLQVCGYEDTLE